MPRWEQPPDPDRPTSPARSARETEALRERYRTDMVGFGPGAHDVRVARDGWVYYVRAVRWGESLAPPRTTQVTTNPLGMVLVLVARLSWRAARRLVRGAWRVGVVRGPDPASWTTGAVAVVHHEVLERGEDPTRRVRELAAEAEAGRWAPAR